MEISDVRKRLVQTIERAKRQAAERRSRTDQAARAFDTFLSAIAVPLFKQVASALRPDGYPFNVFTPSGSVRLMSDRGAEDYIELSLDPSGDVPQVIGHTSRNRGRRVIESERPLGEPDVLTEEDVLEFLLKELEAFVER
jgi:hypothetical protein